MIYQMVSFPMTFTEQTQISTSRSYYRPGLDTLDIVCAAQLTRDLFAIAKFLFSSSSMFINAAHLVTASDSDSVHCWY